MTGFALLSGDYGLPCFYSQIVAPILDCKDHTHQNYHYHFDVMQECCTALAKKLDNDSKIQKGKGKAKNIIGEGPADATFFTQMPKKYRHLMCEFYGVPDDSSDPGDVKNQGPHCLYTPYHQMSLSANTKGLILKGPPVGDYCYTPSTPASLTLIREQQYQDFCKKQILIAENLHDHNVLAIWDKLWRLILQDLPHLDPPRKCCVLCVHGNPKAQWA
ncbi:hypothetical protein PILCRDRAFT_86634 [Piloderma croceum F 1598]|uniref:Uncharacterized protein n=1 Tax=Piloderma croceum (strain F 1598) TaxID=765440 RepID=A0A0C3C847_PILCF|nr:hypothetical protein PILCRDRAFT_86634 [Piloderma croceum F 1598]